MNERRKTMDNGAMTLVLPFDSDDPEFTRGVEIGMAYSTLRDWDGPQTFTMHASNLEMILRLAESTGRTATAEGDGDFVLAVFSARRESDG